MRKQEKEKKIGELSQMVESSQGLVLLSLTGVGARQMAGIRNKVRQAGCPLKVVRNTLMRRALLGAPGERLGDQLGGPMAALACGDDLVAGAKTAVAIEAEAAGFRIKSGFLASKMRSREEVVEIASLPPREVLCGQLVFLLRSPASGVVQTLRQPIQNLVATLQVAAQRKSEP